MVLVEYAYLRDYIYYKELGLVMREGEEDPLVRAV